MLHLCNAKALFFALVVATHTGLWFNSCNFPKWRLSRETGDLVQTLENLEMKKTLVAIAALAATGAFAFVGAGWTNAVRMRTVQAAALLPLPPPLYRYDECRASFID